MHNPTGLFVYGGWGQITTTTDHVFPTGTVFLSTSNMFFLSPGIERKWNSLGKTNIFGEYRRARLPAPPRAARSQPTSTLGRQPVIQKIDNADSTLYVVFIQNSSGDVLGNARTAAANFAPIGKTDLEPFQILVTGAKINF